MTNQSKNNLIHFTDPTCTKVKRLFVLSFENADDRTSLLKLYIPNVEIEDFSVLAGNKRLFNTPMKNKEEI